MLPWYSSPCEQADATVHSITQRNKSHQLIFYNLHHCGGASETLLGSSGEANFELLLGVSISLSSRNENPAANKSSKAPATLYYFCSLKALQDQTMFFNKRTVPTEFNAQSR
eukprot:scaffold442_cov110-Cylindrotheca_fusiformis.AAC.1